MVRRNKDWGNGLNLELSPRTDLTACCLCLLCLCLVFGPLLILIGVAALYSDTSPRDDIIDAVNAARIVWEAPNGAYSRETFLGLNLTATLTCYSLRADQRQCRCINQTVQMQGGSEPLDVYPPDPSLEAVARAPQHKYVAHFDGTTVWGGQWSQANCPLVVIITDNSRGGETLATLTPGVGGSTFNMSQRGPASCPASVPLDGTPTGIDACRSNCEQLDGQLLILNTRKRTIPECITAPIVPMACIKIQPSNGTGNDWDSTTPPEMHSYPNSPAPQPNSTQPGPPSSAPPSPSPMPPTPSPPRPAPSAPSAPVAPPPNPAISGMRWVRAWDAPKVAPGGGCFPTLKGLQGLVPGSVLVEQGMVGRDTSGLWTNIGAAIINSNGEPTVYAVPMSALPKPPPPPPPSPPTPASGTGGGRPPPSPRFSSSHHPPPPTPSPADFSLDYEDYSDIFTASAPNYTYQQYVDNMRGSMQPGSWLGVLRWQSLSNNPPVPLRLRDIRGSLLGDRLTVVVRSAGDPYLTFAAEVGPSYQLPVENAMLHRVVLVCLPLGCVLSLLWLVVLWYGLRLWWLKRNVSFDPGGFITGILHHADPLVVMRGGSTAAAGGGGGGGGGIALMDWRHAHQGYERVDGCDAGDRGKTGDKNWDRHPPGGPSHGGLTNLVELQRSVAGSAGDTGIRSAGAGDGTAIAHYLHPGLSTPLVKRHVGDVHATAASGSGDVS